MGIAAHIIEIPNGLNGFADSSRIRMGLLNVAYAAGGSAGAAVTTALPSMAELPATAAFFSDMQADVTAFVTGSPATGLSLVVEPRLASSTVGANSLNILIIA